MHAAIAALAWVLINGFPVASFDTCQEAEDTVLAIKRNNSDLVVTAQCDAQQVPAGRRADYYGPRTDEPSGDEPDDDSL